MQLFKRSKDAAASPAPSPADVNTAYERGRRDERERRRIHPILSLMVVVVALIGGGMLYLGAREGSFSRGGEVVDQGIAHATGRAQTVAQGAVSGAGADISQAGQSLQQTTVRR